MSATYPLAIRTFTTKRNLLDDVDAADVNNLQDEIRALETVLGVNPAQDSTLVNDVTKWKSVGDRLNYMSRRSDVPVVSLYRDTLLTSKTDDVVTPSFPAPSLDTHGLFNGSNGIKIKRQGIYHLDARVRFMNSPLKGTRELIIRRNGVNISVNALPHSGSIEGGGSVWPQASWTGRLNKNDVITMVVRLETSDLKFPSGKYSTQYFGLDAFLVRDI